MAAPTRGTEAGGVGKAQGRDATAEAPGGPHDEDDVDPAASAGLVDFGAVRVPVPAGATVSTDAAPAGGAPQAVHMTLPEGRLSVSALAAPRSERLWPELAKEIIAALRDGGARVRSFPGDWGRELHVETDGTKSLFVGVDGPRWMVYGVATGPAVDADALDAELRRLLRGTVVVRGRAPYPVRTVLPLTLPPGFEPPEAVTTAMPPAAPTRPAEAAPPVDAETTLVLPPIPAEPVAEPPEAVTTAIPQVAAAPPTDAETTLELPPIPAAEPVTGQLPQPVAEPPPAVEADTIPGLEPVTQPLPVIPPTPPIPAPPAPPRTSGRHARPEPDSAPQPRDGSEPALAFLVDDPLALFTPPTRPGRHRRRA
jgi:hypothetical protein